MWETENKIKDIDQDSFGTDKSMKDVEPNEAD